MRSPSVLPLAMSALALGLATVAAAPVLDGHAATPPVMRAVPTAATTPVASGLKVSAVSSFTIPSLGVPARNTTGHTAMLSIRGGVVSDPGQNGHLYLEVASDNNGAPGTFTKVAYVATRNAAGNTGQIANGSTLTAILPPGAWYRLELITAAGYATPTFVYDGPQGTFVTLD